MKRFFKIIGWSLLWLILFWAFLIIGFPAETAKGWVADRIEKRLDARVSIEELSMRWDLDLRFRGISIIRGQGSGVRGQEYPLSEGFIPGAVEGGGEGGFTIKIGSLTAKPRLISLIRFKPEIAFTGSPSSGGYFSGSYSPEWLSLSFKDVLFKDFTIATVPAPSTAMLSGSGKLKIVKGKGAIEIEVDGIPGGKQKTTAPGGEGPGLDGKLKVTVSIPGLKLPQ